MRCVRFSSVPQMTTVFEVSLYIVEPGVNIVFEGNNIAGNKRLKDFCQFHGTATGNNNGVHVPVIGPKSIHIGSNGPGCIGKYLVPELGDIDLLTPDFYGAGFDGCIHSVQFDVHSALFP